MGEPVSFAAATRREASGEPDPPPGAEDAPGVPPPPEADPATRLGVEMAVLMIVSMRGPTEDLLAASDRIERGIGMPDGLLARVIAPTEDGIVLVNLWASEELRRASNDDPAHQEIVRASGIAELAVDATAHRYETSSLGLGSA